MIATGTPEQVAKVAESYTGQFLKPMLPGAATEAKPARRRPPGGPRPPAPRAEPRT